MYTLDLTIPQQPRLLGEVDVEGRIVDIAVGAGVVYLACLDRGVAMVEVAPAATPAAALAHGAADTVALHGMQAYVVAGALWLTCAPRRRCSRRGGPCLAPMG